MEKNQQELIMKLGMFEQQIYQLQQQLQAIEQGMTELTSLSLGLEELIGGKNKDILAPVGRGIFVNAKLISEDLIVDVGGKNFVKKNIKETQKLINNQISKLNEMKQDLNSGLENINEELQITLENSQKEEE